MAVGSPPTVRRRQLGRELRRLREESGLLAEQLAERLRYSASKLSRIENAKTPIAPGTVHEILDVLGVDGSTRERLVTLARQAEEPRWWQSYTDTLPYGYTSYVALESEAVSLRVFEPIVVYGLLQTEAYAAAIVSRPTPEEAEAFVAVRRARQAVLRGDHPVKLHVVLDEAVLYRVIGGREVLRDQLRHLVEMAKLPNVAIQVLPFESADALRHLTGPAVIMEFPGADDAPVVYLENLVGDQWVERPEDVQLYLSAFDRLQRQALSRRKSAELIESLTVNSRVSLPSKRGIA